MTAIKDLLHGLTQMGDDRENAAGEPDLIPREALTPQLHECMSKNPQIERDGDLTWGTGKQRTTGSFPLSISQQRLFRLGYFDKKEAFPCLAATVTLRGRPAAEVLPLCLKEVMRRHLILSGIFCPEGCGRFHLSDENRSTSLVYVDLTGLKARARATEIQNLREQSIINGFDPARGPLWRFHLLKEEAERTTWLLSTHQGICDRRSLEILLWEIATCYVAFRSGRLAGVPKRALRYMDIARRQQRAFPDHIVARHRAYWSEKLEPAPSVLQLPLPFRRPDRPIFALKTTELYLPIRFVDALRGMARHHDANLFMVTLAAFQVLLYRYSSQDDLIVGTTTDNRDKADHHNVVGPFGHGLPLRVRIAGDHGFESLLTHTRQAVLEGYSHRYLAYDHPPEKLPPHRPCTKRPYRVLFERSEPEWAFPALPGQTLESYLIQGPDLDLDLALTLNETDYAVTLQWSYRCDLFDEQAVRTMGRHLQNILLETHRDPHQKLSTLPLTDSEERQRMLYDWNQTLATYPEIREIPAQCRIHELFEIQVSRAPHALALRTIQMERPKAAPLEAAEKVIYELSYEELNQRANQTAHLLRACGIGPEKFVAVFSERDIHTMISVLGILKAGGAYVPLEPDWPKDRIRAILTQLDIGVAVINRSKLQAMLDLKWKLPRLEHLICPKFRTQTPPPEPFDENAASALWDHVIVSGSDQITRGGFYSSFTGNPFSEEDVIAYRDHVVGLARPYTGPEKQILEVGCGSGLITFALAPHVDHYTALDPSSAAITHNLSYAESRSITNVELLTGFAHETAVLQRRTFDLILLASTIQFFPGHFYLRQVVQDLLTHLTPGGVLLFADVMNPRQKDAFRKELEDFKRRYGHHAGMKTKDRLESELYVGPDFFMDLPDDFPEIADVHIRHRDGLFDNELKYRYDVIIKKALPGERMKSITRKKNLWTGWHLSRQSRENPNVPVSPRNTAYTIFTSGSTGTPKGVMVQHAPVVNLIDWVNTTFNVCRRDRVLLVSSLCFDLSVYDIFGMLAAGGTVQIASKTDVREPTRLLELLSREPITFWDSAPAAFLQLLPLLPEGEAIPGGHPLRLIFWSGDWIPVNLPDRARQAFPNAKTISLGGATEASIWSNYHPIETVDPAWPSVPYGKPIWNAAYHVLDANMDPVVPMVAGDLYIGGDCLSMGYAGDATLTAKKYVPNPFSGKPGDRLYYTGDRVRYHHDGNLEFLGRNDHQVKIRGFRIEMGEIESALLKHPRVQKALVMAREDKPGQKWLVAYVCLSGDQENKSSGTINLHNNISVSLASAGGSSYPDAETHSDFSQRTLDLRSFLNDSLPEYMIPQAFVTQDKFPLTPNGKVDRKALPTPRACGLESGFVAPQSTLEKQLVTIWQDILELDRIGTQDHFIALGGHSLLATQILSRIRKELQVELLQHTLFEAGTIDRLAKVIISHKLDRGLPNMEAAPRLRSHYHGMLPLSSAQQRLWFLNTIMPDNPAYNIPFGLRLKGNINVDLIERGINRIIERHEALRTTFALDGNEPVQVIHPKLEIPLWVVELKDAKDPTQEIQRNMREEGQYIFNLTEGPLIRAMLLLCPGTEAYLLVNVHHMVFDGWSVSVFVRELLAFHQRPDETPEALPLQYPDYAVWQQTCLQQEVIEKHMVYWREKLSGKPPMLELPQSRSRPSVPSFRGERFRAMIPPDLTNRMDEIARTFSATPFMVYLAAFKVLLHRYCSKTDLVVGSPIANRNRAELEPLIGFFINTLVLRSDLTGNPTFQHFVERVRETTLAAYNHEDVPFEKLVDELNPTRSASFTPLFQVMFILQNLPIPNETLPDLSYEVLFHHNETAKFDLTLELIPSPRGMQCMIEYSTDLFEEEPIKRFAQHYLNLLADIAANPYEQIAFYPLLSKEESTRQLETWNDTAKYYPKDLCIHQLLEAQAQKTPDAVAVVYQDHLLTYRALNEGANQLAHHLLQHGVRPGAPVSVCVPRSTRLPMSIFAVIKAGGSYLPLDPKYPSERRQVMLDDCKARFHITSAAHIETGGGEGYTCLLDQDASMISNQPRHNPSGHAYAESRAYILYTSGSTGKPKGVQIAHRSVVNMLFSVRDMIQMNHKDTLLAVTTISFDIAGADIFLPLMCGGRFVLATREESVDGFMLAKRLRASRPTVMSATPATWRILLAVDWEGDRKLRIISTGEALPRDLADTLLTRGQRLFNLYGPTETTVWSTGCEVKANRTPGRDLSESIGTPLANTRIHILNRHFQLSPVGVPGGLCIGGDGLALGYLNRPALTAESFTPHPYSRRPGERTYFTGDMAAYRLDGGIRFLGRLDHQIKIRGFRVEPSEVESALTEIVDVREALVMARHHPPKEIHLVAYVVAENLTEAALRAALSRKLPDYMVPAYFMLLDKMPLTPNGKINRAALPAPEMKQAGAGAQVPPDNYFERELATIWREVLNLEKIGVNENFFDLGGHSLLFTHVFLRIKKVFGVELPVRYLYDTNTLQELAKVVGDAVESEHSTLFKQKRVDFEREAELDPKLALHGRVPVIREKPKHLLLTGATGFVGAFILDELLKQTDAVIYCLVRASSYEAGMSRIEANLEKYDLLDKKSFSRRVRALVGDLTQPLLGLTKDEFQRLGKRLDAIFHGGAIISFVQPYEVLKPTNVSGAHEIIRLAFEEKVKPLHHISTVGVFDAIGYFTGVDKIMETDHVDISRDHIYLGYSQSKWVAEKMAVHAISRGLPVSIHRLGIILGHSLTGHSNPQDAMLRIITGCLKMGVAPDIDKREEITPVDFTAKAVVRLSLQTQSLGKTYHICSPIPIHFRDIFAIFRDLGYPTRILPYAEWRDALIHQARESQDNPLFPLLPLCVEEVAEGKSMLELYYGSPYFDSRQTEADLAGYTVSPPPDRTLFATYLSYLKQEGVLD